MHVVTLLVTILVTATLASLMVWSLGGSGGRIAAAAGVACVLVQAIFVLHNALRAVLARRRSKPDDATRSPHRHTPMKGRPNRVSDPEGGKRS